ncbi:hypothetical protein [Pelagerythrobacter marinus]|uniref:hypothetical protein n=1 Tax=Pelagerythrobacter marinus TaxID=538382 RepID=UPI002AC913B8|nr:hypothetical protein [Pelagerythrobacter marinus]WPZ05618.1 hypothetical protein T8T98_09265 [Pelagerythrobacter marinus]
MADKGIIFAAPMVRALLDGRKTQTRRLIKPAPFIDSMGNFCAPDRKGKIWNWGQNIDGSPCTRNFVKKMPYAPGDRLYVREAFAVSGIGWGKKPSQARGGRVHYRTDPDHGWQPYWGPWNPSIHMPRWASRLTLLVTDVRVQRVAEISEEDAIAEGAEYSFIRGAAISQRRMFELLWNSLHDRPGQRWEDNPWVVAVRFDVKHGNIDRINR